MSKSRPVRKKRLDIDEDIPFQTLSWKIQRFAWLAILAAVLASAGGLFGDGLFSEVRRGSASGHTLLRFDRFTRYDAPSILWIECSKPSAQNRELQIHISRPFFEVMTIESIVPRPLREVPADQHVAYFFEAPQAGTSPMMRFNLRSRQAGLVSATVQMEEDQPVTFEQFVFP